MLELLKHRNISMGTTIEIKKKFGFDHSLEVKIPEKPLFIISEQVAQNILVQYEHELNSDASLSEVHESIDTTGGQNKHGGSASLLL